MSKTLIIQLVSYEIACLVTIMYLMGLDENTLYKWRLRNLKRNLPTVKKWLSMLVTSPWVIPILAISPFVVISNRRRRKR